MIEYLDEVTSTNDVARDARFRHGDIIWAERQTAGRGQRGHAWQSAATSLTFSLVVEPVFLPVAEQFRLSEVVALSLCDALGRLGVTPSIKWTNDIYVGDRKVVGILIEHGSIGTHLRRSIIGIGINVNDESFSPDLPNPASLYQLTGCRYDRRTVLELFAGCFAARFAQLERAYVTGDRAAAEALHAAYNSRLYRLGVQAPYRLADGKLLTATLTGVDPDGTLRLQCADGTCRGFLFRQINFVVTPISEVS